MNVEKEIINNVITAFNNTTGLKIDVDRKQTKNREVNVKLKVAYENRKLFLNGEIKLWITRDKIGYLIQKIKSRDKILLTNYVTPQIAEELKNKEIQFLDTVGNAYINRPPLFIYIKGNKLLNDHKTLRPHRLFGRAGLKLIFAVLNKPEILNEPYRNIAYAGNVALGTVAMVLENLKNLGFVIDRGKQGIKIIKRDELIERWVENYNEVLRPKIIKGIYTTDKEHWWKDIDPGEFNTLWGGEIAANILTKYLKPQVATVYTTKVTNKYILKNKLVRAEKGNVEILDKFWNFNYPEEQRHIVPPLLIYADLIRTADDRNIETAKIIYEREILKIKE